MNQAGKKRSSSKVTYITAVVVLMILAVAVVLTSQSRGKKGTPTPGTDVPMTGTAVPIETDPPLITSKDTTKSQETTPLETTAKPTAAEPIDVPPTTFALPAHGSLSKGHDTETLVYSLTMNDYRTHSGIDIVATVGSAVYAAADGVISEIWEDPLMGKCVSVAHSGGMTTVYKNLSPDLPAGISTGAAVGEGDTIAAVGETALIESADEPHLHFEVILNGEQMDPTQYITTLSSENYDE